MEVDSSHCLGFLNGLITDNTADAFDDYLARNKCRVLQLTVGGAGGDIDAAMRIGRSVREIQGLTTASEDSPCLSACVLVFVGGVMRSVVPIEGSVIGVHSYYRVVATQSKEEATAVYNDAYFRVKNYLEEMRVPISLLDLSYSVPPWKIRMLTAQEVQDFHLEGEDPVYRDLRITEIAKYLKVPIEVYYQRLAAYEAECSRIESAQVSSSDEIDLKDKFLTDCRKRTLGH